MAKNTNVQMVLDKFCDLNERKHYVTSVFLTMYNKSQK